MERIIQTSVLINCGARYIDNGGNKGFYNNCLERSGLGQALAHSPVASGQCRAAGLFVSERSDSINMSATFKCGCFGLAFKKASKMMSLVDFISWANMYAMMLLVAVCVLLSSCSSSQMGRGHQCSITSLDSLELYKVSSFKSWLLLESKDSRYAPLRLSTAALHPSDRQNYLRSLEEPPTERQINGKPLENGWSNSYKPSAEAWPISTSSPIVLKPANLKKDINLFIEELNLPELAQLCYHGQKGQIYYIRGERKAFPKRSPIRAAYAPISPTPYIPAYFATNSSLDLTVLMDNIWLLYQLSTSNLIESYAIDAKKKWKWSKLAYKSDGDKKEQFTKLPNDLKKRYAILELIQAPKGVKTLPAIDYQSSTTREIFSDKINELRAGEGYAFCENARCYLANQKHQLSWDALLHKNPLYLSYMREEFKGHELWLNSTKRQNFVHIDSEFKKGRAISQYELFAFPVEIDKFYQNKRQIVLIFDSK